MVAGARNPRSSHSPASFCAPWVAAFLLLLTGGFDQSAQAYYLTTPTGEGFNYTEAAQWCADYAADNGEPGGFLASIPGPNFNEEVRQIVKSSVQPDVIRDFQVPSSPGGPFDCFIDPTQDEVVRFCYYLDLCNRAVPFIILDERTAEENYTVYEWKAFIGLRVASHPSYEDGEVLWEWSDGVPYQWSDWFASEPDHVNAQNGLDPSLIATAFTIQQQWTDPYNTRLMHCVPDENRPGLNRLAITESTWWGDIDVRGKALPRDPRQPAGEADPVLDPWNLAGVCKIGRFDRANCTVQERLASGCHERAACEFDFVDYYCTCPEGWTSEGGGFGETGCSPPPEPCTEEEANALCPGETKECKKSFNTYTHVFQRFECCDSAGDDSSCLAPSCEEDEGYVCHVLASCDRTGGVGSPRCLCPEGAYGHGTGVASESDPDAGCSTTAWAVRLTVSVEWITPDDLLGGETDGRRFLRTEAKLKQWYDDVDHDYRGRFARIMYGLEDLDPVEGVIPEHFLSSMNHFVHQNPDTLEHYVTVNGLFRTEEAATAARNNVAARLANDDTEVLSVLINQRLLYDNHPTPNNRLVWGPNVYTWVLGTTSDVMQQNPTGLTVDSVHFRPSCLDSGCWVFDVTYTSGENNWNVWYIPRADNDDSQSFDTNYDDSVLASSYLPANFPCGSDGYDPEDRPGGFIPDMVSACCIPAFVRDYRAAADFEWGPGTAPHTELSSMCSGAVHTPPTLSTGDCAGDPNCWSMPEPALSGKFHGMNKSYVESRGAVDPFVGIYKARFYMDEQELRQKGGMLAGTVGVEHTVRTFVGLAEFKPTETTFVDMFTKQVDIYLEKTSFFSVSTHGTNDYTFLQYVNLRLVEVLDQDIDNTDGLPTDNFDRTGRGLLAQYVQVTFTLGSEYELKNNGMPLVPLDSVRVRKGAFADDANMYHACTDYGSAYPAGTALQELQLDMALEENKAEFDRLVAQSCAPQSRMCANPSSIPDSFVSFNVPVGLNWFPSTASDLSHNVFVSMVVQAQNADAVAGTQQGAANITKTTLNAAIPVVSGGINIFCDGITAKTDLKDVARAVIVVGSAGRPEEITRLRILGESNATGALADSVLDPASSVRIDTDSIESALMTLVILGNPDFFYRPLEDGAYPEASSWGLELEDAITIHIMESDFYRGFSTPGSKAARVLALIEEEGEELYDSNNTLQTDGYLLNGAFEIQILRDQNRARLTPSPRLLAECGFSATQPTEIGVMPQTCVLRRDVSGRNSYPVLNGRDFGTAIELPHCGGLAGSCEAQEMLLPATAPSGGGGEWDDREEFMASIFGDSLFARELGRNFSHVIAERYSLDDRANRAWWINPGYEWTPSQTAEAPVFQVSQKLMFFALFALNEQRAIDVAGGARRRVLLATASPENSAVSSVNLEFDQDAVKLLTAAAGVDASQVVPMRVVLKLTQAQVCLNEAQLRDDLRIKLLAYVGAASWSDVKAVSISNMELALNGASCPSRRSKSMKLANRQLLETYSDAVATVEAIVAFGAASPRVARDTLEANPDVVSVSADWSSLSLISDEPDSDSDADDDGGGGGGSRQTTTIAVAVAVGVLALLGIGTYLYWKSKGRPSMQAADVSYLGVAGDLNMLPKANPVSIWNPSATRPVGLEALHGDGGLDLDALQQEELLASLQQKRTASQVSGQSGVFGPADTTTRAVSLHAPTVTLSFDALDDLAPSQSSQDQAIEAQLAVVARKRSREERLGRAQTASNESPPLPASDDWNDPVLAPALDGFNDPDLFRDDGDLDQKLKQELSRVASQREQQDPEF